MRIYKTSWMNFKRCLRSCILLMLSIWSWLHTCSKVLLGYGLISKRIIGLKGDTIVELGCV
ncbi:hypothetical protein MTR67_012480 [Solanum verrucosum]|uniref:Uncharacterized protein n=1 Tax=Solanum verrucosum TaxID=315347 RepID=A0AAF0QD40_SOLVR|nr:hypothetical protein MTR67_012480 [Solanum verrucosum]